MTTKTLPRPKVAPTSATPAQAKKAGFTDEQIRAMAAENQKMRAQLAAQSPTDDDDDPDEDAQAGGTRAAEAQASPKTAGGRDLRERISSQAIQKRRDFYPGGGDAAQGPMAELSPSKRAFGAHVATAMERGKGAELLREKVGPGGFKPAAMVRAFVGGSGQRFNAGGDGDGGALTEVCPPTEIWDNAVCNSQLLPLMKPESVKGKVMKVIDLTGMPTVFSTPKATACSGLECRTSTPVGTELREHEIGKLGVHLCIPLEDTEDAFIDVVDAYTPVAERAILQATEEAYVRGDDTLSGTENINHLNEAIVLTDVNEAPSWAVFDGFAHATLIDNPDNILGGSMWTPGSQIEAGHILKLRTLMWDAVTKLHFGFCSIEDLIIITDAQTYAKLLDLEDVKWVEKRGPDATILTGLLPHIWGIPIVMIPSLALTNIDGKVDIDTPGNNVYGQLHVVNMLGFKAGVARELRFRTVIDEGCELVHVYITWRGGLARRSSAEDLSGIEAVASMYGIAA